LNLTHEPAPVSHPYGRVLLSTHLDNTKEELNGSAWLRADEGIIVQIELDS